MHIEQVHNICSPQKEVRTKLTEHELLLLPSLGGVGEEWGRDRCPDWEVSVGTARVLPLLPYRARWHCWRHLIPQRASYSLQMLQELTYFLDIASSGEKGVYIYWVPTSVSHTPGWYISFTTNLQVGSTIWHLTFVDSVLCAKLSDRQASYFISIFTAILEEDITLHFVPRRKWSFGVAEWLWEAPWLGIGKA